MYAFNIKLSVFAVCMMASICQAQTANATALATAQPMVNSAVISSKSSALAAEIQMINEEMTVLSAKLARVELEAKIAAKKKEMNGAGPLTPPIPMDSAAGSPSVVSVTGLKGKLEATLVFPGGVYQRVRSGDVVGDKHVTIVSINEVIMNDHKGKNPQRLAFGSSAIPREVSLAPSTMTSPFPIVPSPSSAPAPFNR